MDVSREPALRRVVLFLLIVAIATWIETLRGAVAFTLGIGFAWWVLPSLERWVEWG